MAGTELNGLTFRNGTFTTTTYNYVSSSTGSVSLDDNSTSYAGLGPIHSTVTAANVILNYGLAGETITITGAGAGATSRPAPRGRQPPLQIPRPASPSGEEMKPPAATC